MAAGGAATEEVTIDPRLLGPGGTGRGGAVCALLAEAVPGSLEVFLHHPLPPLGPLTVHARPGHGADLRDRGALVAEARPCPVGFEPPPPVALATVSGPGERVGPTGGARESCAVGCAASFEQFDGQRTAPGDGLLAAAWTPAARGPADGEVLPAGLGWVVLDAAGRWAATSATGGARLWLRRLVGVVHAPPEIGTACVVVARDDGRHGDGLLARSALYSASGRLLAVAATTWDVTVRAG